MKEYFHRKLLSKCNHEINNANSHKGPQVTQGTKLLMPDLNSLKIKNKGNEKKFEYSYFDVNVVRSISPTLWADDETLTTRANNWLVPETLSTGNKRIVRRKCPMKLTAICFSIPSTVFLYGVCITAAGKNKKKLIVCYFIYRVIEK